MTLQDVRLHIERARLRPYQILTIGLCVMINLLDGFDILAVSLISPILSKQWQLGPQALGVLFSAGLVGTAVGGFALSPLADIWGRRTAIMINLGLMSIGMLLSTMATNVETLAVLRFCTGLGIGAMAGCAGTLAFEYSSLKTRTLSLGLVVIGYTVGTLLSGYVAPALLADFSWRGIFGFGGLCSLALLPVMYWVLPESLDILIARQTPRALTAVNRILLRLRIPVLTELPAPIKKDDRRSLMDLLRQPIRSRTTLMALSYFLFMVTEYFFLNWNNQLTTDAGFSYIDGVFITRLTSLGGIAGGVAIGILGIRLPLRPVGALTLLMMGLSLIAFGAATHDLPLAQVAAAVNGFGIFGAAVAFYSIGATTFPARVRATGMGVVMSAGRVGSIFGPFIAGELLGAQFSRLLVCVALAIPALLAIATLARVPLVPVAGED